jgi:CubicO group peptidase (beta-lactamase class C family)
MKYSVLRLLCCWLLIFSSSTPAQVLPSSSENVHVLNGYEGEFSYRDSGTLYMVEHAGKLFAITGEAKYGLRFVKKDEFANGAGDALPFMRDAQGQISGFQELGVTYLKRSSIVPKIVRAMFDARSKNSDGSYVSYQYQVPAKIQDGIAVASVGGESVSIDIVNTLVNQIITGNSPDVRSILIYHKGALRLEEYFYGYHRERSHQMRSLTKSVISLVVGAAVDRGMIRVDEPVLPKFEYASIENPDPRKSKINLRHMLSNQSGLACNDRDSNSPGNEVKMYEASDWIKMFVDLPVVAEPGTVGRYCSAGMIASARIVERVTSMSLDAFAKQTLFEPLGINAGDWKWRFQPDRSQRNEFGQIYLRPRDMLKLGILIQQGGRWHDKQVISNEWISAATARQSKVDGSDYGLGIWHRWYQIHSLSGEQRVETIMLSGNGGQKVFIVPDFDLIVVFTGGSFNSESPVNKMMASLILPAIADANAREK